MIGMGDSYYDLEQMVAATLSEAGLDEYGPPWVATEGFIVQYAPELDVIRGDIAELFANVPDAAQRLRTIEFANKVFGAEQFDEWLHAVDRRIEQAMAGDHSQPINERPKAPTNQ